YARELLELHTLSPGHYTETDVREFARCLTGWSIYRQNSPSYGLFQYIPSWHDTGAKDVLGMHFTGSGGQTEAQTVIDFLKTSPITAQFVSRKMCRWLLTYTPSQALVDQVASTYLATGGDIKAMIRVILRPDNVQNAQPNLYPKIKRPFHFEISLL